MDLKATEYAVDDRIATITLSRPHRGNAWTGRMHAEYRYLLGEADADPSVRVILVTGSGERFCVGGDSQALDGHSRSGAYDAGTPADLVTPGDTSFAPFAEDFAYHLLLSSRKFLTDEAHAIGLVHRLVAPGELIAETRAYALDLIARVSPEALRQTKRQTYLDFHRDIGASVRDANALMSAMVKQPDYKEAIAAFLAKRPAEWSGG